MTRVSEAWLSGSATTRRPREGEVEGVQSFFVSTEEFERMIAADELLEWAQYSKHYYGTPRASVEEHIAQGQQVILEIETQGAMQVKTAIPEAHLIFIEPPSLEVLKERLVSRGTETEDEICARLATAQVELARKMEYNMRLVNDNLDVATDELVAYIEACATGDVAKDSKE